MKKIKPTRPFRISAKKIYLTYSQVHHSLNSNHILQVMKKKENLPSFHYLIAKESHADGGIHFHLLLIAKNKFNIKTTNALDIEYQGHTYHGNYQSVRSADKVVEYVCKDGNYITDLTNIRDGKLLSLKEMLISDVKDLGLSQALIKHSEESPNAALSNTSLISAKNYFDQLQGLKQALLADQTNTPFKLKDFNLNPDLQAWVENPNKTLFLVGESGIGKTSFCKAFVNYKGFKTLIVNHKEDLKRLDASYDAIIVDDANLDDFQSTQLLALVDNQVNKTLRVLYNTAFKKANTIQMINANKSEFRKLAHVIQDERFARRIHFEQIKEPFIINLNVNIQINNKSINSNITFAESKRQEQDHVKKTLDKITKCLYD